MTEIEESNRGTRVMDVIPTGVFFSGEYDPERIAALRKVMEIGERVAETHPEVADSYRDTSLTYLEIAERYLPKEVAISAEVAAKAIGVAVRSLIPEEEQAAITARRRAESLREQMQGLGEAEFRAHQQVASRQRHQMHGVDVGAMLRGRGRAPWNDAEKRLVLELCGRPEFQHQKGNRNVVGSPNYANIAFALNELVHSGKEIRYGNSVGSLVRDMRREKSKSPSVNPKT